MGKKVMALAVAVVMILALGNMFTAFSQEEKREIPKIPGITAEDAKPQGCINCHHKDGPEGIYPLTVRLKEWTKEVPSELLEKAQAAAPPGVTMKGQHVDVVAMTTTIPKDCLTCHSKQTAKIVAAPEFARLLHLIHLVGGEENPFITDYQGQCTHCHALNQETGEWTIKGGEEQ